MYFSSLYCVLCVMCCVCNIWYLNFDMMGAASPWNFFFLAFFFPFFLRGKEIFLFFPCNISWLKNKIFFRQTFLCYFKSRHRVKKKWLKKKKLNFFQGVVRSQLWDIKFFLFKAKAQWLKKLWKIKIKINF